MELTTLITIITTVVSAMILYCKWKFSYWKRKGVPYIEPKFPFGTSQNPLRRKMNMGERIKIQYSQLKAQGHKHAGLYFSIQPTYLPIHPDYLKNIMCKDFWHFNERGFYFNEKDDPLTGNLFCIEGQKWKQCRIKMAPAYTSGKIKMMFATLVACGEQLIEAVDKFAEQKQPFNVKTFMEYYTTDCIGSCAFGVDCNSFKHPENEFRKHLKTIFGPPRTTWQAIKGAIAFYNREIAQSLGIALIEPEVTKFFINMAKESMKYRENANTTRKDFMQTLIDLKYALQTENEKNNKNETHKEGMSLKELAAHTFVFFLGGYETSSILLMTCLFELASNQKIQDRLRGEIKKVLQPNQSLTYESIMEISYLNQVVDEILRKYPPGLLLTRLCVQDYKIPNTDVTLEKGTRVLIPVYGLHHDPEYFPEPDLFNPDRFSPENRKLINPYTYLPFGEGPRNCIGLRLGLMQIRVGIASVIRNFRVSVNQKTILPLKINPNTPILQLKNEIWLDVERV